MTVSTCLGTRSEKFAQPSMTTTTSPPSTPMSCGLGPELGPPHGHHVQSPCGEEPFTVVDDLAHRGQQPVDALGIERGHHRRHVGKVGDGGPPGTAGCDAGELHPLQAVHTSAPVVIIVIIAPPGYVTTTTPWTNCTVTYSGC
jgi:hypothetical protein